MFANRRSSQKPDEGLYAAFRQTFPEVGPGTSSAGTGPGVPVTSQLGTSSIDDSNIVDPPDIHSSSLPAFPSHGQHIAVMASSHEHSPFATQTDRPAITDDYFSRPNFDNVADAPKGTGTTPKPFTDQWRLTPSLLDPSSYAFSAFANQPPGYYTPTPGGFNTLWHSSAAGDLHTPGALGLNTPLSLPQSMHAFHASDQNLQYTHYNPQLLHPQQAFQDPFHAQSHHHHLQQQQQHQNFPHPGNYIGLQHEDSGYAAIDDSSKNPTPNQEVQPGLAPPPIQQHDSGVSVSGYTSGEKFVQSMQPLSSPDNMSRFRFHTTLNAPTAMVRNSDEIPVTYLNKGQAYTMSVYDTNPPTSTQNLRYRTYVRVSFEDEQQRAKSGACWQLWREGRGSNEAHQRGGKLLAVEYVDPNQGGDDTTRKPQIELERASFDGFVVNWHPNDRTNGVADCSISVRFNFLSTDFSHSKGVKGIPVRLCSKTELLTTLPEKSTNEPEVCFAKVKLFRDHGAERKLSNDIAHVKKSIEKLKQQIAQAEAGVGNVGKKKRSGSMAKGASSRSRTQKHKRSWSADSDAEGGRLSAEEDLHMKLVGLQDMFSSTRPMSVLYLKGDPEDDPDLFPVKLAGGDAPRPIERAKTWESRQSGSDSPISGPGSPTPSSVSLTPKRKFSELQQSVIEEEEEEEEPEEKKTAKARSASPERPAKMIKREVDLGRQDLYALDVDSTYDPPPERPVKPGKKSNSVRGNSANMQLVACFYVKDKEATIPYYRAVYLARRTVEDLIHCISEKFGIDPNRITRVTHVNSKGLQIIVDEDVVREMQEGQDMIVEFAPAKSEVIDKHGSDPLLSAGIDGDSPPPNTTIPDPLEMWLNY
ncbi:hypothetical protein LTR05_007195 [Lithohypha guttulata]|uniref:Grh/CP2 DB domain-containing protein n=1 Tax=Lithohypha guttulata TaxID=1690604 RepID=A0AAN7SUW5_9EURO|nr:hypothetical protein LTR05_007195 [Lithohypha guttulata]